MNNELETMSLAQSLIVTRTGRQVLTKSASKWVTTV